MSLRNAVCAMTTIVLLTGLAACGGGGDPPAAAAPVAPADTDSASGGAGADTPGAPAGTGTITMQDIAFSPAEINVKRGATVRIVNKDSTVHDVIDAKDGIKSGDVKANGTGSVKAPDKAGSYPFICTYHPNMKATLVVT